MAPILSSDNKFISEDILFEEKIVLLDRDRNVIGSANKLDSHHMQTPFHLAFSIYLFNEAGQVLVTKRAHSKKVWPAVWTNSCCGHPMPNEEMDAAIKRRCDYELGIVEVSNISMILADYEYMTPAFNSVIENEFCPVYAGIVKSNIVINPKEVDDFKWLEWDNFIESAHNDKNDEWSWWCKDQLKQLSENIDIQKFYKK